jgi:hypothetical protein
MLNATNAGERADKIAMTAAPDRETDRGSIRGAVSGF